MATPRPFKHQRAGEQQASPLHKGLQQIKDRIDEILARMKKDEKISSQANRAE